MLKTASTYAALVLLALAPLGVLAATPENPSPAVIADYSQLFAWVFGFVSTGFFTLLGLMLRSGNKNNEKQWEEIKGNREDIKGVALDVAELRGEHNINHGGSPTFRRQ